MRWNEKIYELLLLLPALCRPFFVLLFCFCYLIMILIFIITGLVWWKIVWKFFWDFKEKLLISGVFLKISVFCHLTQFLVNLLISIVKTEIYLLELSKLSTKKTKIHKIIKQSTKTPVSSIFVFIIFIYRQI